MTGRIFFRALSMLTGAGLFLTLPATHSWAGTYQTIIANTEVMYEACMRRCARQDALGNLTRNGCLASCAETRREFPLNKKSYSSYEKCAEDYARIEVMRDQIIAEAQEECLELTPHVHKRQGCKDAITTFYNAATEANVCGRRVNDGEGYIAPIPASPPMTAQLAPTPAPMLEDTPKYQSTAKKKTGKKKAATTKKATQKSVAAKKKAAPVLEKDAPMPTENYGVPGRTMTSPPQEPCPPFPTKAPPRGSDPALQGGFAPTAPMGNPRPAINPVSPAYPPAGTQSTLPQRQMTAAEPQRSFVAPQKMPPRTAAIPTGVTEPMVMEPVVPEPTVPEPKAPRVSTPDVQEAPAPIVQKPVAIPSAPSVPAATATPHAPAEPTAKDAQNVKVPESTVPAVADPVLSSPEPAKTPTKAPAADPNVPSPSILPAIPSMLKQNDGTPPPLITR